MTAPLQTGSDVHAARVGRGGTTEWIELAQIPVLRSIVQRPVVFASAPTAPETDEPEMSKVGVVAKTVPRSN